MSNITDEWRTISVKEETRDLLREECAKKRLSYDQIIRYYMQNDGAQSRGLLDRIIGK